MQSSLTKTGAGGTGLGLAIVKNAIKLDKVINKLMKVRVRFGFTLLCLPVMGVVMIKYF